jgi:thiosulfate/3-mercaptopyruvate sulfurtransferase
MSATAQIIEPGEIPARDNAVIIDCRFSLADSGEGAALYRAGHIPGAHYLDLEHDMSSLVSQHGGRHPLPDVSEFVAVLAALGVGPDTRVIAYDDSRLAYAARLWWMMKSLGYKPPELLNGGYQAWLQAGGIAQTEIPVPIGCPGEEKEELADQFSGVCDIQGLRDAQGAGCIVVDSREEKRYQGLEEPIDPVAGHIPGAINRPWQGVSDSSGRFLGAEAQRHHWGKALEAGQLVVYCGSGVTACVNLFSLSSLGRDDAILYSGSWSDWCSHLQ